MSDIRLKEPQDGDLDNQSKNTSQQGDKKKMKKNPSTSSLQNVNINGQYDKEIDSNSIKDKKRDHLEEELEDEPYKRRSKRNSTSKRNSKSSAQVPEVASEPGEVRGNNGGRTNASGMEITSGNLAPRPPKGKVSQSSPQKAAKENILETDFDSINVEEKESSDTIKIVKINATDDRIRNNSDVKIVIINNDDEDDSEDEEDDSNDDQEAKELNGNCDDKAQAGLNDMDDKLWFINSLNIIDFCREVLTGFSFQDLKGDEAVQNNPETEENQKKVQQTEINDVKIETQTPDKNDKVPDKGNESQDISKGPKDETPESSNKTDLVNNYVKNDDDDKTVKIPKNISLDHKNAKPQPDIKKSEINDKPQGNLSDKSDLNTGAKQTSNQNPVSQASIKNNNFNLDAFCNIDTYSKYRPPSRSSFKMSQTDNVPIPNKPPIHSTLGRPPPPPGTVENKPLTLTAYVVHKRSPDDAGGSKHGHAQNTPRRQKRLDKTRSRSADPLGRDEEENQGETEFDNSKDVSSDSINWERYSCTLPFKWSSSSILSKPGLVPTRSEEYLIIRRSDGKIKSLNNSRDNIFRSFQSLDKLNDSEMGSTSSKISRVGLNKKHQIITTTTTTEETFVVPKIEDKTDGGKQQQSVKKLEDANEKLKETKIPAQIEKKQKPSVAEKGVGSTNISLKDAGVGPEKTTAAKTDKISKNVGVVTDPLKEMKPDKPKPSSTVTGQQTDFVIVQAPSKHFDGSTQTGAGDQNMVTVPVSVQENPILVTFTPVTPEEKPKEPDLFVSQVNSFEFCEVNTFYIESDDGSNDQQAQKTKGTNKGPSKGHPPPSKNEKPFPEKTSSNEVHVPKLVYQNPTDDISKPHVKPYIDEHLRSPIPPISPHHFDVHAEVTPSNKFDAIFSPDNHRFARQLREDIPGQKYVINYSDGTTAPRDLNYIDLLSKNKSRQEKPSKIPRSLNSFNKDVSSKKRDRSCERVVEISEKSRVHMPAEKGIISQETTKGYHKSLSDELDGSLSDEKSEASSPRKLDTRRSRITMSYHGPLSPTLQ